MKSHPVPSLLGLAAVLVAALVVAVAFGVSTGSPAAQAQADDPNLINITTQAQLDALRHDADANGVPTGSVGDAGYDAYVKAFPPSARACTAGNNTCAGYELMNDITLSGVWTPIPSFGSGAKTFDGNGHTISGLTIDSVLAGNHGLFAGIQGGTTVKDLGLTGVSVTVATTSAVFEINAGGLAGVSSGEISGSYVEGSIDITTGGRSDVGGLVGENSDGASIVSSYSTASVTVTGGQPNAGGLVGFSKNGIVASYAMGDVTATGSGNNVVRAGGFMGYAEDGDVLASYATGDVSAEASGGDAAAGGLAGAPDGNSDITASYSTGSATSTSATGTATAGGLAGSAGVVTASYWDTDTSGITATTTASPVGHGTSALQTPTDYAGIYAAWKVDVDADDTVDEPWDFGRAWQYPVLKYGLDPAKQRPQVTLTPSAASISERGGTATLTPTLSMPSKSSTVVELTATGPITLSASTITFAPGKTTTDTVTVSAVDNTKLGAHDDATITGQVQVGGSGANNPATVTIAITDDEDLAPTVVQSVRVRTKATLAVVTWAALDGADAYKVEWARSVRGSVDWSRAMSLDRDATRTSATVRRLDPATDYAFRVSATNMDNSWSATVNAATEGEDDGASPFPTYTPTPTPTPVATPIPPTTQVGTSTAVTLTSSDGTVTIDIPAGSRSAPYQVNFESQAGCDYAGAKADVTFTCVTFKIFDADDMLETDVEFDAAPTVSFTLTAEQVENLGGEFLLAKLHEMGGLMIVTRASADGEWTSVDTTLTMDDETGGATLSAMPSGLTTITAVAIQATYDAVQAEYGHLLPRDTLTPPTGGPSVPAAALLALLLGAAAMLATGWVLTARRNNDGAAWRRQP